jgi:glycosyltransferase involved in cell wall biosynthesis
MNEVSAVIPCIRCDDALVRAVASVAAQTRLPGELILVNDGGGRAVDDGLAALSACYRTGWIVIVSLADNTGPAGARNAGWDVARGRYVAFLDADDAWHPCKLQVQTALLRADPAIAVCGHAHRVERHAPCWDGYRVVRGCRPVSLLRMLISNPFVTPSVMAVRDLPLRFETTQRHMEDFRLWLAAAAAGLRVVRSDAELACVFKEAYGVSGQSASLWRMQLGELAAYRAVCRQRISLAPLLPLLLAYSVAKFVRRLCVVFVRDTRQTFRGRSSS